MNFSRSRKNTDARAASVDPGSADLLFVARRGTTDADGMESWTTRGNWKEEQQKEVPPSWIGGPGNVAPEGTAFARSTLETYAKEKLGPYAVTVLFGTGSLWLLGRHCVTRRKSGTSRCEGDERRRTRGVLPQAFLGIYTWAAMFPTQTRNKG
ncbi:uncharacterized protein LOC142591443 [Dermacentor variabilis]|uniref:uncharacterized protein LOC142591443 n=1 Tax=Dermacentor variabilis TaxID=34621 RepID=UPI003F5BC804